jgi:cell division protein FtsW
MMAIVFCLVCFGVVMVYSATSSQAVLAGTSPFAFVEKQLLYAGIGVAAFTLCRRWDPRFLHRIAGIGLVASIGALFAVLVPGIGVEVNGARRWISFPLLGQVQPA